MTFTPSDVIALVSVAGTVLVALASAGVNLWQARRQRDHERELAFEGRAWELKSTALFAAIRHVRGLLDAREAGDVADLADRINAFADETADLVPVLDAYASSDVRRLLGELRAIIAYRRTAPEWAAGIRELVAEKAAAFEAQDFRRAAELRRDEHERRAALEDEVALPDDFESLALRFIDAARESVRRAEG